MWNPKYDLVESSDVMPEEYSNKIDDLMALKNNIGWNLDKLAAELDITGDLLRAVITQEVFSEDIVNQALILLKPLYDDWIAASRKEIQAREKAFKQNRFPDFSKKVREVNTRAKEQDLDLFLLLNVSKRTMEKWLNGYSVPQGFTRFVIEKLYEDYDTNIQLVLQLHPIEKT